ncbi:MAG: hypothetical protein WCP21_15685, partial [Armatimonadota bacterium]
MAVMQPVSDVIRGRRIDLHFSPEGVALLTRGWRKTVPPQVARYEEMASVGVTHAGRALVITFIDERPPWAVLGLRAVQA